MVMEGAMFGYGWCGGMGVGGWLFMGLLWGGFLAVVVWAVMRLFPRGRPGAGIGETAIRGSGEDTASVLDRQLAAGEIDEETYRRVRGELTGTR